MAVPKEPRSFSIDEDIDEMLADRDDLNASAAVNAFLREYVATGRGEEAALEVRLDQLDEEISDLQRQLDQKKRERERIEHRLEERRSDLEAQLTTVEQKVRAGEFPRDNVDEENPAIQNWASKAGVEPKRFVDRLKARI